MHPSAPRLSLLLVFLAALLPLRSWAGHPVHPARGAGKGLCRPGGPLHWNPGQCQGRGHGGAGIQGRPLWSGRPGFGAAQLPGAGVQARRKQDRAPRRRQGSIPRSHAAQCSCLPARPTIPESRGGSSTPARASSRISTAMTSMAPSCLWDMDSGKHWQNAPLLGAKAVIFLDDIR